MKHITLLFAFSILAGYAAFSQTGYFPLGSFGSSGYGNVEKSNDGKIMVLYTIDYGSSLSLMKMDLEGNIIWETLMDSTYSHPYFGHKIIPIPGQGYYVFSADAFFHLSEMGDILQETPFSFADMDLPSTAWITMEDAIYTGTGFSCIFSVLCRLYIDDWTNIDSSYYGKITLDMEGTILSGSNKFIATGSVAIVSSIRLINTAGYDYIYYNNYNDSGHYFVIDKTAEGSCDLISTETDPSVTSIRNVLATGDGFILWGESADGHYFLTKINTSADLMWTHSYNHPPVGLRHYHLDDIAELGSGNLIGLPEWENYTVDSVGVSIVYFSDAGDSLTTIEDIIEWSGGWGDADPVYDMTAIDDNHLAFIGYDYETYKYFILVTDTLGNYYHVNLSGKLYHDANSNGSFDVDETVFSSTMLKSEPLSYYGYTNANGDYNMLIGKDTTFTISVNTVDGWDIIEPEPLNFNSTPAMDGDTLGGYDFMLDYTTPIHNVSVSLYQSPIVPGFASTIIVTIKNTGNQYDESGIVYLHYPSILLDPVATPAYTTIADTTINWNYNNLDPYETQTFTVSFIADTLFYMLGEIVNTSAEVTTTSGGETELVDNIYSEYTNVTGAFDPNHITVSPAGTGADGEIEHTTQYLTYTIDFQNTGTAATHFINIYDTLDNFLYIESIEMLSASNDYTLTITAPNILRWKFDPISLPDSATDLMGSMGYLKYRIKIKDEATIGDIIENKAGIYFDYNPVVLTNMVKNKLIEPDAIETIENGKTFNLYPNPTVKYITLDLIKNTEEDLSLTITGISGAVYMSSEIHKNVNSATIDISKLLSGIYTVTLYDNLNKPIGTKRFEVIR